MIRSPLLNSIKYLLYNRLIKIWFQISTNNSNLQLLWLFFFFSKTNTFDKLILEIEYDKWLLHTSFDDKNNGIGGLYCSVRPFHHSRYISQRITNRNYTSKGKFFLSLFISYRVSLVPFIWEPKIKRASCWWTPLTSSDTDTHFYLCPLPLLKLNLVQTQKQNQIEHSPLMRESHFISH